MKKIIEKYKKFIFIYVLINLFALIINTTAWHIQFSGGQKLEIYPLTASFDNNSSSEYLWPFVKYYEYQNLFKNYGTNQYNYYTFNGIFYEYDITEFLLYVGLLFIILFYKSYIQNKKVIPIENVKE